MRGILGDAFPKQSSFLKDECRFRAACCTRRAGKSFGIGLLLFARALAKSNVTCLYISLTRESAKRIMWRDVLHVINDKYDLRAVFNETALSVTLPNGSNIYLLGGDANAAEAAKFKGLKPVLAVVDECQDFRTDLEKLCTSVIRPALIDNRGDLLLCGVPGVLKNYFWKVTTRQENTAEWSVHEWSGFDNPHMVEVWGEEIASLKEKNPRVVETPWFQQEYLGKWAIDTSALVYSGYRPEENDFTEQPNIDSWQFILGVDFGWTDATALTLGAWSEYEDRLYILKSKKRTGLTFSDVAEWIETYRAKYPIHAIVVDGSSKQGVEEIRQRHGIPLEAADKRGKADAIAMMNSDMMLGRVMVLQPHCKALTDEWGGLVWDPKAREKGQLVEHPACENHNADSCLYLYRRATNYSPLDKPKVRALPQTTEAMDEFLDERDEADARKGMVPWWEQ